MNFFSKITAQLDGAINDSVTSLTIKNISAPFGNETDLDTEEYRLLIGSEVMTVTGVTDNGSTYDLTVTRGVEGAAAAHGDGDDVGIGLDLASDVIRDAAPWTIIQSQEVTSAVTSVDFTSGIDGTYEAYILVATGFVFSVDGRDLQMLMSRDGGSNWDETGGDYLWDRQEAESDTTGFTDLDNPNASFIQVAGPVGNATGEFGHAIIDIFRPASAEYTHVLCRSTSIDGDGNLSHSVGSGVHTKQEAVDGIRLYGPSANITAGRFTLYGIRHA